jgi:hypothetical protein
LAKSPFVQVLTSLAILPSFHTPISGRSPPASS